MAPLDPGNTDRLFLHYQNGVHSHTTMIRTADGADLAVVVGHWIDVVTLLTGAFFASAGLSVDFQAAGDHFSTPVSGTDWDTATWGSGAATITGDAVGFNFQGRSPGGHKCRVGLFGYKNDVSNWRLTEAEAAAIGTAVGIIQDDTNGFYAIDGTKPTWYGYVNIKFNDYWVRKGRS